MTLLLLLSLLATPKGPIIEGSAGLGGIQWETANQAKVNSSSAVTLGIKYPLSPHWLLGTGLTFNAYDGDEVWHVGPGLIMLDAMIYRTIPMEDFMLILGAGAAISMIFSLRELPEDDNSYPAGSYTFYSFGLLLGFQIAITRTLTQGVQIGLNVKYFSGAYMDRCFKGPVKDCREIDNIMQHWIVGLSLSYQL